MRRVRATILLFTFVSNCTSPVGTVGLGRILPESHSHVADLLLFLPPPGAGFGRRVVGAIAAKLENKGGRL
jgi:hypothetical protein